MEHVRTRRADSILGWRRRRLLVIVQHVGIQGLQDQWAVVAAAMLRHGLEANTAHVHGRRDRRCGSGGCVSHDTRVVVEERSGTGQKNVGGAESKRCHGVVASRCEMHLACHETMQCNVRERFAKIGRMSRRGPRCTPFRLLCAARRSLSRGSRFGSPLSPVVRRRQRVPTSLLVRPP